MKQITIKTTNRTELGRAASKHLREQGTIPAVIYGESGSRNLAVDAHDFAMAHREFSGSAALIELKYEEGKENDSHFAIIQELQRNPRTDAFLHIDFREIVRGQDMEADIPVHTKGTPHGVRNYGGVLEVSTQSLRVRCRPRNLPEMIVLDVHDLEIGNSIHLSEIEAPEGVEFLDDPDLVLVGCVGATALEEEEEKEEEAGEEGLEGEEGETAEGEASEGEASESEKEE